MDNTPQIPFLLHCFSCSPKLHTLIQSEPLEDPVLKKITELMSLKIMSLEFLSSFPLQCYFTNIFAFLHRIV